MPKGFKLLMITAMYENGGNTVHRHLDGHPQLHVYPFESQIGTALVSDLHSGMFPAKYRWPLFALDATPAADFQSIIDEECRVRARTPRVSKFRHVEFVLSDTERCERFCEIVGESGRSSAKNVMAFFQSTFDVWKNCARTNKEQWYVGYSPAIVVDGAKILTELPDAHVLHVVRNPWSAYADTKKRPVPLTLDGYMVRWVLNQYYAQVLARRFPDRFHIVRAEDVMADPATSLGALCERLGLEQSASLSAPSWNAAPLDEVYPWGTIRQASSESNRATADELSEVEKAQVREFAEPYLDVYGYRSFL